MSVFRVYAETGECLLDTGSDDDYPTETVRDSLKSGVRLYYDPERRLLRCYVQVRRSSAPEQFLFEYRGDGEGNVVETFVDVARAEMAKSDWTILEDTSPEFVALENGVEVRPEMAELDIDLETATSILMDAGEPVDFAATDRTAAVGVINHLRRTFDDEYSLAISHVGRDVQPATDADLIVIPDRSHTGLTADAKERLETERIGYLKGTVTAQLNQLKADAGGASGLVERLERRGIDDRLDAAFRPESASYLDPAVEWLLKTVALGIPVAVLFVLVTEVPGPVLELLSRRMVLIMPSWTPSAVMAVVPTDSTTFVSGWLVAISGVVFAVTGTVCLRTIGGGTVKRGFSLPTLGAAVGAPSGDSSGTTVLDPSLADTLDEIRRIADADTERDVLTAELDEHGIDVVPARRADGYAYAVRLAAVAVGVAMSVGAYVYGSSLVRYALTLVASRWAALLEAMAAATALLLGGTVVVGVGTGAWRLVAALRRWKPGIGGPPSQSSGLTELFGGISLGGSKGEPADDTSRQRIEDFRRRLNDGDIEYLKRNVDVEELVTHLKRHSDRTDIARFLKEYDDGTTFYVLSGREEKVVATSLPAAPSGQTDTDETAETPESIETGTDETGDSDAGETTTEAEGSESAEGFWEEPALADDGADDAPSATPGDEGGATDANRPDSRRGFPSFRYGARNTGFVPDSGGGRATDPRKENGWTHTPRGKPLSPVVADGTVYVVDASGNVDALDAETGDERWTTTVDDRIASMPAVRDGVVYFGSDSGTVYAVERPGEVRWAETVGLDRGLFSNPAEILAPPTVQEGRVYLGDMDGGVHALDASSGERRWRENLGDTVYGKAAYSDGGVYVVSDSGRVARFDARSGDKRGGGIGAGEPITTTPALVGDTLYVVDRGGEIHRVESEHQSAGASRSIGDGLAVSPTVGDERVFVGLQGGAVVAVDTQLRESLWQSDVESGDDIEAPFVLGEEALYVAAGRRMYAFDPATGDRRWDLLLSQRIDVQPALASGTLFVATDDRVRALDLDDT